MVAVFAQIVIVDWSASAVPKRGADSIWIACVDVATGDVAELTNPSTRREARQQLARIIATSSGRVLIGADFPMGPPTGSAAAIRADGESLPPWTRVWRALSELVSDDNCNCNNRFAVAAELNRRMGRLRYWGTPASSSGEWLTVKKPPLQADSEGSPGEFRMVERLLRTARHRPFSWWQLYGVGSVGSQVITGIPVLESLRNDPSFGGRVVLWPFETGLRDPLGALAPDAVVIAEVWPSMLPTALIDRVDQPIKDARQVVTLGEYFASADRSGSLADWFAPAVTRDLGNDVAAVVVAEEGWVLGVSAAGEPIIDARLLESGAVDAGRHDFAGAVVSDRHPTSTLAIAGAVRDGAPEFARQSEFGVRFECGPEGLAAIAPDAGVVVIVDILRFTTAVSVAVQRGTVVLPYRWNDASAAEFAQRHHAVLAGLREHGSLSLSPTDLLQMEPVERLVLPSPNGSAMSLDARGRGARNVLAGSLRNASATARLARHLAGGHPIAVVACGERWGCSDGPLRPSLEDAIGAGAIINALRALDPGCNLSPEARGAAAMFTDAQDDLFEVLAACASGRELVARGGRDDIAAAAEFDASPVAAKLVDGRYEPVGPLAYDQHKLVKEFDHL